MGKSTNIVTMEEIRTQPDNRISIEVHLDEALIEENSFFRQAVTVAGLWDLVTAKPTKILTTTVAKFPLNLREGELSTSFTDPSTSLLVFVNLVEVAGVFRLPNTGETDLTNVGLHYEDEYMRFAKKNNAAWSKKGNNIREDLQKPFNFIGELFTKTIACHIGGLGGITDTKIYAITVIVDSLAGLEFNWQHWFIRLIQEAARDFEPDVKNPDKIVLKSKLRLLGKLSYVLEKLYPGRAWPQEKVYQKSSVFYDMVRNTPIIDSGLIDVVVRPRVKTVEKKKANKGKKKVASSPPTKKAKRVQELARPSEKEASLSSSLGISELHTAEGEEAASQEGEEVMQPQPKPTLSFASRRVIFDD